MNATITNAPSPSAAERMRIYRERRRNGLRSVRILLHDTEINSLISKGMLNPGRRHNHTAVENAVGAFICSTLGLHET